MNSPANPSAVTQLAAVAMRLLLIVSISITLGCGPTVRAVNVDAYATARAATTTANNSAATATVVAANESTSIKEKRSAEEARQLQPLQPDYMTPLIKSAIAAAEKLHAAQPTPSMYAPPRRLLMGTYGPPMAVQFDDDPVQSSHPYAPKQMTATSDYAPSAYAPGTVTYGIPEAASSFTSPNALHEAHMHNLNVSPLSGFGAQTVGAALSFGAAAAPPLSPPGSQQYGPMVPGTVIGSYGGMPMYHPGGQFGPYGGRAHKSVQSPSLLTAIGNLFAQPPPTQQIHNQHPALFGHPSRSYFGAPAAVGQLYGNRAALKPMYGMNGLPQHQHQAFSAYGGAVASFPPGMTTTAAAAHHQQQQPHHSSSPASLLMPSPAAYHGDHVQQHHQQQQMQLQLQHHQQQQQAALMSNSIPAYAVGTRGLGHYMAASRKSGQLPAWPTDINSSAGAAAALAADVRKMKQANDMSKTQSSSSSSWPPSRVLTHRTSVRLFTPAALPATTSPALIQRMSVDDGGDVYGGDGFKPSAWLPGSSTTAVTAVSSTVEATASAATPLAAAATAQRAANEDETVNDHQPLSTTLTAHSHRNRASSLQKQATSVLD